MRLNPRDSIPLLVIGDTLAAFGLLLLPAIPVGIAAQVTEQPAWWLLLLPFVALACWWVARDVQKAIAARE